jgi:hypothetical protein
MVATSFGAAAQQQPTTAPPAAPPAATAGQPDQDLLKPEQLEALVAPIALYPDALLANMLAAATYPLEVVEADRWIKEKKNLKGDALKAEVDKKSWDDSVKALTATPSVLDMMSDKLDWTKSLGDAMLAQQADLMDAIQRLREKARANNKLSSNKQQKVTVKQQESKQVIVIEPTDPNTMYVPYYEPAAVYGAWPYAAYPRNPPRCGTNLCPRLAAKLLFRQAATSFPLQPSREFWSLAHALQVVYITRPAN